MMNLAFICNSCKHEDKELSDRRQLTCAAFPEGIPYAEYNWKKPDDITSCANGLTYEPLDADDPYWKFFRKK
jgi:hypothetical protein